MVARRSTEAASHYVAPPTAFHEMNRFEHSDARDPGIANNGHRCPFAHPDVPYNDIDGNPTTA
jgi:hypothetical protein